MNSVWLTSFPFVILNLCTIRPLTFSDCKTAYRLMVASRSFLLNILVNPSLSTNVAERVEHGCANAGWYTMARQYKITIRVGNHNLTHHHQGSPLSSCAYAIGCPIFSCLYHRKFMMSLSVTFLLHQVTCNAHTLHHTKDDVKRWHSTKLLYTVE